MGTVLWFQEASRVLLSNACRPVVTDGITMFLNVLLDMLFRPVPQPLGNVNLSRDTGNAWKTSDKTLSPYAKRLGMVALADKVANGKPPIQPYRTPLAVITEDHAPSGRKVKALIRRPCASRHQAK